MRKLFILFFLLPLFSIAQTKKPVSKKAVPAVAETKSSQPLDGFIITGNIEGYSNGTPVSFLNEQTGEPEKQATITNGKFVIKGKMKQPGFKGLIFADAQPLIPIFLDNSNVKITGNKNALDKLVISGSSSHTQYSAYMSSIKPYEKLFLPDAPYDSLGIEKVAAISEDFVTKNPNSFVSPLAIIKSHQVKEDVVALEKLFNLLSADVKSSSLGAYLPQLIADSKINPLGSVVKDFIQADTAGFPVSLSSFHGKYVLIDFWASWCGPCRQENPNVVAAYNKFKDRNFTILGVSLDKVKGSWVGAIKMDGLTWSQVSDLKYWQNDVAVQFHITSIPQNLLLDPEGRIIGKNLRGAFLDRKLNALLK